MPGAPTLLGRGFSAKVASVQPTDCIFRCSCCMQLIANDAPVYMRHDLTYCSPYCRDRAVPAPEDVKPEAVEVKEQKFQLTKKVSGSSLSAAGNYKSNSTLTSITESRMSEEVADWGRFAGIAKLGQRLIGVLLQRVASKTWGAEVLKTCSSGTALAPIFNFLPQVDQYTNKEIEELDMSPTADSVDVMDIPFYVY
mmetsp:Transcript_26622/g.63461  ORF Transcript_26622/g.63461 Transcript_26622/m.63461 type:complete len:196 (-) Transcript_26622:282-869(-)|eukprot:CAMPEP_0181443656 /NCGR_PEP_ID=MMETSP1110-20121109/24665_1 /TAXON_ID=174948 /ORGANISM="Symbiodinium sp., Strain CCMP421" /LENGTH=195 /DNA_ID=CAMNT_0023567637 /DNA_START=101 /DNA_END=688 /DNA_ORIENTATION=+